MMRQRPSAWSGRDDALDGEAGHRWHHRVEVSGREPTREDVVLLGLASDEGVRRNLGRPGAVDGPSAIRRALANLPAATHPVVDAGDVTVVDGALEAAQHRYAELVSAWLGRGARVVGLGGGHEIGWASALGWMQATGPGRRLGLLNLDAHLDLRRAPLATSGTPFLQALAYAARHGLSVRYRAMGISAFANTAALFETAARHEVEVVMDDDARLDDAADAATDVLAWLEGFDSVYLTLCLDVFPAAVAPGVSAPAALGVSPRVIDAVVGAVAASGKLALFDVAELNPALDVDGRTARLAARMVGRVVQRWR
jgi:formiminoglutamase